MKLPRGNLVRKRVVAELGTPLSNALDAGVTGYARLETQDALLLEGDGVGVLVFEDGVPTAAYHTGTDRGGQPALADMAVAGPYRVELYELDPGTVEPVANAPALSVPPGTPAERLAGDRELAERTRSVAPTGADQSDESDTAHDSGAVEAFLDDEERIAAIRREAREEAEQRAAEWGFD